MYKLKSLPLLGSQVYSKYYAMSAHVRQDNNVHHVHDSETLHLAHQCLLHGKVIALPTDTVYGLACDANNESAIQQLYAMKGRDDNKPVAICVSDLAALRRYGRAEHLNDALLQQLLPGPITIILEKDSLQLSNRFLNPNTSYIGMRIPDYCFIQKLCALFEGQPLALTSANRSGEPSSLKVQEFSSLWADLGAICDAGQLGVSETQRSASTVIDLATPGYYRVVRPGCALKRTLKVLHKFNLKNYNSKELTLGAY